MDGVFYLSDFKVLEKKVGQYTGQHVMMPALVFPDPVMVHPKLELGFFKTFPNGPSNATYADEKI